MDGPGSTQQTDDLSRRVERATGATVEAVYQTASREPETTRRRDVERGPWPGGGGGGDDSLDAITRRMYRR